jgi:class 3 adenylate cyclase
MDCPSCGNANPDGKKFCGDCGVPLPMRCAGCGAENPPGKKFCGDCGAALMIGASTAQLETAPPAPTAERRQLTVMFCDLVDSTALASKLDPEDLREVIRAYHRRVDVTVHRGGGFVAKYMGDGVLVYFGYPQAHGDDAERAVRSGLMLIEGIKQLDAGERLRVRIGIATGLVIVGDLIGAGAAQDQAVVGETPSLAARLQTVAEPDSVVIAASTRGLAGGLFEYDDLGAVDAKGFAEPVRAWRVRGESTIGSRYEALRSGQTPLVGRDEEVELLRRRWRRATSAGGQIVLLSGEPGIGKSRLTASLVEEISGEPHTRLRYFCSPNHTDSALHPFISQLERVSSNKRRSRRTLNLSPSARPQGRADSLSERQRTRLPRMRRTRLAQQSRRLRDERLAESRSSRCCATRP